jgi:hypothetical protein
MVSIKEHKDKDKKFPKRRLSKHLSKCINNTISNIVISSPMVNMSNCSFVNSSINETNTNLNKQEDIFDNKSAINEKDIEINDNDNEYSPISDLIKKMNHKLKFEKKMIIIMKIIYLIH